MERRQTVRYSLSVPVLFSWREHGGEERYGAGFTRDVSIVGSYIVCEQECPPIGADISVQLLIRSAMTLKAQGAVVRLGTSPERIGFAAATEFSVDQLHSL